MRECRPILEESLEEKLENMGLRKVEHIADIHIYIWRGKMEWKL